MSKEITISESNLRELVATVEFLRVICEHSMGKRVEDSERLTRGMRVGIIVGARISRNLLEDYQRETFWEDVRNLPVRLGIDPNPNDAREVAVKAILASSHVTSHTSQVTAGEGSANV